MPAWLWDKLTAVHGEEGAFALTEALNTNAPLDLRVNLLKANRDSAKAELSEAGIETEETPFSATGLRALRKPALQNTTIFKNGGIEVQDEGSQLLAQLLGARVAKWSSISAPVQVVKRWRWVRLCAIPVACMLWMFPNVCQAEAASGAQWFVECTSGADRA
jgi:hypothetical protein